MVDIIINISENERVWLQKLADLHNVSLQEMIREKSITSLLDEYDALTIIADTIQTTWGKDVSFEDIKQLVLESSE